MGEQELMYDLTGETDLAVPRGQVSELALPSGHFTRTGYELRRGLTFDEWLQAGQAVLQMYRSALLFVGDWLVYGEDNFGEDYAQAVEAYDARTLANAMTVSRRFPLSRRSESNFLTFSHYATVTSLPDEVAEVMLANADQERWSTRRLAGEVRAYKGLDADESSTGEPPKCSRCGHPCRWCAVDFDDRTRGEDR